MEKKDFTGEFGTVFMLNSLLKKENMAIGIDVDYPGNPNDRNSEKTPLPSVSFTIGLSF